MKTCWPNAHLQANHPNCEHANRAVAKQGSRRAPAEQLRTALCCTMNERHRPPNPTQICLEKNWLVCSEAKETSPFLSVYLKTGRKLKHHCPCPQRRQLELTPSILMSFTQPLLKRDLGIPDFSSKANLVL